MGVIIGECVVLLRFPFFAVSVSVIVCGERRRNLLGVMSCRTGAKNCVASVLFVRGGDNLAGDKANEKAEHRSMARDGAKN